MTAPRTEASGMSGRGGPVGDHTPILGDAQIFYVAVLGMAGVLLCGELLAQLVTASASAAYGPALLTRMAASPQTVRWIYVFFVLLPACLAVLAIGFPFFLRTLIAALRRRLRRSEMIGFILMLCAFAGVGFEIMRGGDGVIATSAAAVIALWQSREAIGERGGAIGDRLLMTTGAVLLGLVHYERQVLSGAEPSLAVAPTLLVAAFFFGAAGLLISTVVSFRRGSKGRGRVILSWIALGYWATSPQVRRLAVAAQEADNIEVASTAVAGTLLLVIGVAGEFARRKAQRGRYHVAAAE